MRKLIVLIFLCLPILGFSQMTMDVKHTKKQFNPDEKCFKVTLHIPNYEGMNCDRVYLNTVVGSYSSYINSETVVFDDICFDRHSTAYDVYLACGLVSNYYGICQEEGCVVTIEGGN